MTRAELDPSRLRAPVTTTGASLQVCDDGVWECCRVALVEVPHADPSDAMSLRAIAVAAGDTAVRPIAVAGIGTDVGVCDDGAMGHGDTGDRDVDQGGEAGDDGITREPADDDPQLDETGEEFAPEGFERWRRGSALGNVGTGIARGLQSVFAPPPDQPVITASVPGDPPDPERLQVILDPDDPSKSVVILPPAGLAEGDEEDDDPA